ncbi:hypothetical protein EsH8_II_000242 [Colletotrichum jinshuiense]
MVSHRQFWPSHALLGLLSFWVFPSRADYFTEPPSFELDRGATRVTVNDLNTTYVLGQKVQITWEVPSVPWISLSLVHWGKDAGVTVASFLTNERNIGYYTWYIGESDGVTKESLAANPNFALTIIDPTGNYTKTGAPEGFIDHQLQSRGFVIQANATSGSAATQPTPSATETTVPSAASPGLSAGAVAGVAVGCVAAGVLAMLAIWLLFLRKRGPAAPNVEDQPRHHPTPTLHPVMHHEMRQDSSYVSPNSSGDHMFVVPPSHGHNVSHRDDVSPTTPLGRQTPPPSYPSPVGEYPAPMTELSSVREPQEVSSVNPNYPPELPVSHRH